MLAERYRAVRSFTMALAAPLSDEDCTVQSMLDASPIKWHLAHTTWFFERFVLAAALSGYRLFDPDYDYLFNSYYEGAGQRLPRAERGLITRPTMARVRRYREHVDQAMLDLLGRFGALGLDEMAAAQSSGFGLGSPCFTALVGIHHEQQHQELMLTDIQHAFFCNPLRPAYAEGPRASATASERTFEEAAEGPFATKIFPAAVRAVGHPREDSFAFDNERPRHRVFLESFALAARPVTSGEYLEFMLDGGYQRPELWLSDGWSTARAEEWKAPLYWEESAPDAPIAFSLRGVHPLDLTSPVCHVSYYEADAYARWAGARLPAESEWEVSAEDMPIEGNFVESGLLAPAPAPSPLPGARDGVWPVQLFGDVWEWTSSPYVPYPGFAPFAGVLGEYNGKFMCNQMVLRGGSCATSRTHVRASYRNFFPPAARWQFTGIRLAKFA
jgi:ergothioneine biosynthesis protein EgtB